MKEFDIVIFTADKYVQFHEQVVESVKKHVTGYKDIYIISEKEIENKLDGLIYVLDKDACDVDLKFVKRPWIKQQYLKLFQKVTGDNYLVIDGDIVLNIDFPIFDGDKQNMFVFYPNNFKQFIKYNWLNFRLKSLSEFSYVNDIMLFNRTEINRMIGSKFISKEEFIEKSELSMNKFKCSLSEYELYGTWLATNYPDKISEFYTKRDILGNDIIQL